MLHTICFWKGNISSWDTYPSDSIVGQVGQSLLVNRHSFCLLSSRLLLEAYLHVRCAFLYGTSSLMFSITMLAYLSMEEAFDFLQQFRGTAECSPGKREVDLCGYRGTCFFGTLDQMLFLTMWNE
ncbi:hypothetical protein OCU04_004327 [Sclerotinia nivalis]|uniref:Uncharacterized protein n=1 Tax=Sclerotinia nivalis TaxID=352851 RepID=A0A9X0DLS9_9HELO|nr:hypothetical protein OCU04_004327 [Sclerotinia nivalis]